MKIENLLKQPESKILEFKENFNSKEKILYTIIAFANTAGGKVVLGITDKERFVVGVKDPHLLEEKIVNIINDSIMPQIVPNIEVVLWRNKYVIIIDIYPGSLKPYYIKSKGVTDGTYIRSGSTTRLASQEIINGLSRSNSVKTFDEGIMYSENSEAIDFRVASELFSPYRVLTDSDLFSLGVLVKEGTKIYPSIGGMILFGINRYKHFPDSWIQVGCFEGANKAYILDNQEIRGIPPIAINEAMNFIKKHLISRISINNTVNEEVWSVPKVAIREAVINAIVHADYSLTGSPIRISIFEDRIEIENPGLLAIGITLEDIISGISKIRNRVFARVFQELHLIEQWGSGITRMITSCKEAGIAEPCFEEISTRFRVTFYRQRIKPIHLDEVETKISLIVREQGPVSTAEIAKIVGLSARAVRTRLIRMVEKGEVVEIAKNNNDPKKKYIAR
jgi:ATP-dependent DNA helicase RecG